MDVQRGFVLQQLIRDQSREDIDLKVFKTSMPTVLHLHLCFQFPNHRFNEHPLFKSTSSDTDKSGVSCSYGLCKPSLHLAHGVLREGPWRYTLYLRRDSREVALRTFAAVCDHLYSQGSTQHLRLPFLIDGQMKFEPIKPSHRCFRAFRNICEDAMR